MIIVSLLLPAVAVAVVVWVLRSSRHRGPEDRAEWSLRRVVQYAFLLAALFSAANGLTRVLTAALPAGERMAGPGPADLALGLSLAAVASPIWMLLWRIVRQRLAREADERGSAAWSLYLATAATVALIVGFVNLVAVGAWALGAQDFDGGTLAAGLVWTAAWGSHAWLLRRPALAPTGTLANLPALAGSAVGLVGLAIGVGGLMSYALGQLYQAVAGPALVAAATTEVLRRTGVIAGLGAVVWWWHWLREALHDPRGALWYVYVLLVAILGALLVTVVSAATVLHTLMQWLIGEPEATRATVHFAAVPGAFAAAVVGSWVWWYHRAVLADAVHRQRGEPERAYDYLVAAGGMVAGAAGVSLTIVAVIQALGAFPVAATDPRGRNTLAIAVTLLLIGVPLWWTFWRRLQTRAATVDTAELGSASRRAYLLLLFGAAGLTAAVSLVVILFVVLRDLLEGSLAPGVLHELRAAIALVLTAGSMSAYHWAVQRDDRAVAGVKEPALRRHVLLVSSDGHGLADQVAERTGASVRTLHRLDVTASQLDADAVVAAILASPHARLLVTIDEDGTVRAIPYESR